MISPLIEESEHLDVQNAEEIYRMTSGAFLRPGVKVGALACRKCQLNEKRSQ